MQLQQAYILLYITIFTLKLFGNSLYRRDHSKISKKDPLRAMARGIPPATKGRKSLRHVNNANAKQLLYSLKKKIKK